MTNETAKELAAAMNRLAAAIERVSGMQGLQSGIHVYHHGASGYSPNAASTYEKHFGAGMS